MCVRPFAWGGMVLIGVVAFMTLTTVRLARHQQQMSATIVGVPNWPDKFVHVSDHGQRMMIKNVAPTKLKSRRSEDLQAVIWGKPVEGLGLTKDEAFVAAIEEARALVTHDLGLTVPVSAEFVRERLKADQGEAEPIKDFIKGEPAYRVRLDLQMNRGTYLELAEAERGFRVDDRMEGVGRILSVVVVALGALAGYIRLDDFTKGYYTGRLRALAVVLVAAATFAISRV
jgi:hypothetical protein